jgi:hypothetical protein
VVLVALHGLDGQIGVLDIVAILQKLDPLECHLVAGRRQIVSCLSGHCLVQYLKMVRIWRHSARATRSCLPVQQLVAANYRHSFQTTQISAGPHHSTGLALASHRYSVEAVCARYRCSTCVRSGGAIDNWRPEASMDACRMLTVDG